MAMVDKKVLLVFISIEINKAKSVNRSGCYIKALKDIYKKIDKNKFQGEKNGEEEKVKANKKS